MTEPLFMARLAGTQEEMGTQHGQLVADDAAELVAFYRTMPERALAGDLPGITGTLGRVLARGVAMAWQARLAKDRPRELAARSRAFMTAALGAAPCAALYALGAMDALQNCVSLAARARLGPFGNPLAARAAAAAMPACSTVIAWGEATDGGHLLFARNFDFPGVGVWDAAPAFVVNVPPSGGQRYAFFARRGADTAVVTCVNEAGLVLAPHTRWHTGVTFGGAMIVDVVHDIARRAETLDDAIRIARERPISSSWGIAVGSAREASGIVLEIAGPQVEVVRPTPDASFLVCANRYRSPALHAGEVAASAAWAHHSDHRERKLRALVEARTAPLTAEQLARFLGNREDVTAPGRRRLGSVLAEPTNVHCAVVAPALRRALVGVDRAPCCEGTWAELSWTWDGPPGGWQLGNPDAATAGFTARTRSDVAPPHDEATLHVHEAARAHETGHDTGAARAALERAIAAAPDDPSLYLGAAWLALVENDAAAAIAHVERGLALETDAYRRGQLLLWGVRAARTRDPVRTARWTDELLELADPHVDELKAALRRTRATRPHVNLLMADAY